MELAALLRATMSRARRGRGQRHRLYRLRPIPANTIETVRVASSNGATRRWIRERDQFGRVFAHGVSPAIAPAIYSMRMFCPTIQPSAADPARERSQAGLTFRVVRDEWREHADAPHSVRLLGAGGEWVRRCGCATESSDAPHGLRSPAEGQAETLLTNGPMSFPCPNLGMARPRSCPWRQRQPLRT